MANDQHVTVDCVTGDVALKPMTNKEMADRAAAAAVYTAAAQADAAARAARVARIQQLHGQAVRSTADNTELLNLLIEHLAPGVLTDPGTPQTG